MMSPAQTIGEAIGSSPMLWSSGKVDPDGFTIGFGMPNRETCGRRCAFSLESRPTAPIMVDQTSGHVENQSLEVAGFRVPCKGGVVRRLPQPAQDADRPARSDGRRHEGVLEQLGVDHL